MSTSERRSGSSGPSKKRKSVYISTSARDRARKNARHQAQAEAAAGEKGRGSSARSTTAAQQRAEDARAARERRMSAQTRSMYLRIAGVVAAFALVVASCVGIYDSPLFTVSRIEVVGAVHLTADEVRTLAALPQGSTLLRFPADAVAANVEKDPWVASASVSRVFPDGMRIRVTERVPVALVDVGRTFWLVDAQGVTIAQRSVTASGSASASASVEPTGSLPVIRDVPGLDPKPGRKTISEVLLNAVAVLGGISRELAAAVTIVSAPTIDGTTLLTNQRVEIVIGQAIDLTTKDTLARRILSEQRGKVVSIDVRSIDRPTWRALPK